MPMTCSQLSRVILVNLALTAVLVLTLGIAVELYFRGRFSPADYRGLNVRTLDARQYTMKANADMVRQGVRIITNSDGFRDKEFTDQSGGTRSVIAVLGDSYTFGHGVPQDQTFPALLENRLNQSVKSDLFRVWNLGVSGYNTEQENCVFENSVLPRAPQWVVVGYNLNDYEPAIPPSETMYSDPAQGDFLTALLQDILSGQFLVIIFSKHRIGNLIRFFKPEWYASLYINDMRNEYVGSGDGWKKVSGLLSRMNDNCKKKGIGFTVAVLPANFDFAHYPLEKVHDVVVSYCHSSGIDCVDVLPSFRSRNVRDMEVSLMDPHPNGLAQQIFSEAIAAHLLKNAVFRKAVAG